MTRCPSPVRKAKEVLIRLDRITICGSDLHRFRGRRPCDPFPLAVGKPAHECLGRVLECDPGSGFEVGEVVLLRPPNHDGMKEQLVLRPEYLYSVQSYDLTPDDAVMAQLLAPVIHCCKRLEHVFGKYVFVIGQGPAGLAITNLVRMMGARFIATSDLMEYRLEESRRRGADETMKASPDLASRASDLTEGKMFDVVIEAVGSHETIALAPNLARDKGRVIFFGLPAQVARLSPVDFFSKQLRITTTEFPDETDFLQALSMISRGDIDLTSMITHRLSFERAPEGFQLADSMSDGVLRVLLTV